MNYLKAIFRKLVRFFVVVRFFFYKKPNVKDINETIDFILKNNCSVSRFGDGELRWMIGANPGYKFQQSDEELAENLLRVLNSDIKNHIICIPNIFEKNRTLLESNRVAWDIHLIKYGKKWYSLLNNKKVYFDANVTRFYIDYKNKKESGTFFNKINKIWRGREVVLIEGELTRFGVGNDLLDNAKNVYRILCPAENAYTKYDEIFSTVLEITSMISEAPIILISLGPTATILSADLAFLGFQSIDIGHLDLEYEWFLRKDLKRTKIENKYVNEIKDGANFDSNLVDNKYTSQIKKIIK
ncbi:MULTISPECIES: SP_1767 family glycosyltransferase [Enterococcus]|nr:MULTISPECIES: SP_1767 family glycosyltransferase [Enterococcus]MCD4985012.1 SP_1767 family glycosyltransferase [Enterococcus gallinarum]VFA66201.1 glycosyltransferase, SP_1767 family [Enterococcus saccharolyticus]